MRRGRATRLDESRGPVVIDSNHRTDHLMNSKTGLPKSVSEDMLSSQLDTPMCGESHPDGRNTAKRWHKEM